jgi:hypothetical protein
MSKPTMTHEERIRARIRFVGAATLVVLGICALGFAIAIGEQQIAGRDAVSDAYSALYRNRIELHKLENDPTMASIRNSGNTVRQRYKHTNAVDDATIAVDKAEFNVERAHRDRDIALRRVALIGWLLLGCVMLLWGLRPVFVGCCRLAPTATS